MDLSTLHRNRQSRGLCFFWSWKREIFIYIFGKKWSLSNCWERKWNFPLLASPWKRLFD